MHAEHAFLIGAMKAGTTTLFDLLVQHPQVHGSEPKEPQYFAYNEPHRARIGKHADAWSHIVAADGRNVLLDGSTGYSKYPHGGDSAALIAAHYPNARFIYIVRDPVSRAISHVRFQRALTGEQLEINDSRVRDLSNYWKQLSRYLQHFDRSSMLICDFDRLSADFSSVANDVFGFLGLGDCVVVPEGDGVLNRTADVSLGGLSQYVARSPLLWRASRRVPRAVRRTANQVSLVMTRSDRAQWSPSMRDRAAFREALGDDIVTFGREFNFDVSGWGFS